MLVSVLSFALVFSASNSVSPAYEAQLQSLHGGDYHAAVDLLGIPEARNPREGGGEVWTFRTRRDGSAVNAPRSYSGTGRVASSYGTGPASGSSNNGSGSRGSSSRVVSGSSSTGMGISPSRRRAERLCTTRIALNPDGTVDGFAYYGQCYPR